VFGKGRSIGDGKMSHQKIKVCVVIPVHNRRDITLLCLRSLSRINRDGLDVHVIIVDDGSTDGTSEAIKKEFPEVEIIKGDGNLWFTEGTNVGVRAALKYEPKYILMMNDDQVFDKNFLKYMVETAEKHERSVVGALLLLWDMPHKVFQVAPVWKTWLGGWRHWRQQTVWSVPKKAWEVDLIVGNCVLVPTAAIKECGLMNSKKFPNFGDAEYTPRLKRKGWKLLIEPRSRVFIQPNTTPASFRKMSFREKINVLFFDLKHPQSVRRRFYAYWYGAPSRIKGLIAFFIFFFRVILGRNIEGRWALQQKERPIAEIFEKAQVED
jgi:GT2 family glycosyltransferase